MKIHISRYILMVAMLVGLIAVPTTQPVSASPNPARGDAPLAPEDIQGQMYCNFGENGLAAGSAGAADHNTQATLVYPATAGANAGKIVALGGYNSHIMLMRFNADGTLDTTFSGDGILPVPVLDFEYGYNAALDSNYKIVVVGNGMTAGDGNLVVVRVNTDGTLDTTFSGDGKVNLDIDGIEGYSCGGDCQYFSGIAIQSDNKILVGGQSTYEDRSTIVRLTTTGGLDSTFGGNGIFVYTLSGLNHSSYIKDIALSSTGEIYVAGGEYIDPVSQSYIARITAAGALDTTFDGDGWKWITINSRNTYVSDLAVLSSGKLATLSTAHDGGSVKQQTSVTVMSSAGVLDTGFGGDGIASAHLNRDLSDDGNGRIVEQGDGKIVVTSDTAGYSKGYMALARFNTDGTLDANFGLNGIKHLSLPYASLVGSQSLAVMNDGNLALLGLVKTGDGFKKFALMKFLTGSMNMSYGFSMALQNTNSVPRGYERDALDLLVCMNGAQTPLNASSFTFNTTGVTDPGNLTSAALYHTTTPIFSNATPVGSSIASPSGTLTYNQTRPLSGEFNHFWLAYTVERTAPVGNVIDGQATALTVDAVARTPVVTSPTGDRPIFDLLPARVFWTDDMFSGTVKRVDPNGSNKATLLDTFTNGGYGQIGMALDMTNQMLYFVQSDNSLARSTLDGSSLTVLMVNVDIYNPTTLAYGIAVDPVNSKLYYANYVTNASSVVTQAAIYRADLDATNATAIINSGLQMVVQMAVDPTNGYLYWIDTNWADGNTRLMRSGLDGSAPTTLDSLPGTYGGGLALDVANNKLYYTDGWGYNLKQANLDGSNKSDLIAGLADAPGAMTIDTDSGMLYWLSMDLGTLYSASIAAPGSGTKLLADSEAYGNSIVFKPLQSAPIVDTPTSASITASGATLGGNLASNGLIHVTERGVYWSTLDGFTPPAQGTKVSETGDWGGTGPFTLTVSGLPSATPIYFKAFAANPAGVGYSSQATFTTASAGCTGVGSGTVPWSVAFGSCPPGAKYIIPVGLNVILDVDVSLDVDLEVLGTLDATSQMKTFTLTGSGNQTLTGNPLNFYRLTVNKTNPTDVVNIVGKLRVNKKLTVTRGKLKSASDYGDVEIAPAGTLELTSAITVSGTWVNNGEFIAGVNKVTFDGANLQGLGGLNPTRFYDWEIGPTAGVFITTTPQITSTLVNNGVISQTQTVGNLSSVSFLHISTDKYHGLDITTDEANNLGNVTVAVRGNSGACTEDAGSPNHRNRCIRVNVQNPGQANLTLYTTVAEDDAVNDTAYQYYSDFQLWADVGTAACDTPGQACQADFVTFDASGDHYFVIGNSLDSPTAITLRSLSGRSAAHRPVIAGWLTVFLLAAGWLALRRR